MRSIKQKLLVRILAMTAAAALICGGVGIAANYISSHSMLEQSLESTASLAATRVSYELLSYQNAVRGLGMVPELSDGAVPVTCRPLGSVLWYGARQFAGFVGQEPV